MARNPKIGYSENIFYNQSIVTALQPTFVATLAKPWDCCAFVR